MRIPSDGMASRARAETTPRNRGCPAGLVVATALVGVFLPAASVEAQVRADVRERVRARIEASELPGALSADGERIHSRAALSRFYESRAFEPAWIDGTGPTPAVDELVSLLRAGEADGLRPADYHVEQIAEGIAGARARRTPGEDAGSLTELELLSTDGFLLFVSHLALGRVDPEELDSKWVANRRDFDAALVLSRGLEGDLTAVVASQRPLQPGYGQLRDAYRRYRDYASAGGWPTVSDGPALELDARGPRVVSLRARLAATGDIEPEGVAPSVNADVFDDVVDRAVRGFQTRHGLGADGIVGPATLAALNVPAAERARRIWLNLERWRWLPADLGRRHVFVNAANFELDLVEDGKEVFTSRVMVGRPFRRTPVFSDRISYLVLNPYWNVPHSLSVQDQIPSQVRDPGYFSRVGIKVLNGWGDDAAEIDASSIDWAALAGGRFPYRLRQDPGPQNFLGKVKIMFPNQFDVYLHDTPARALFQQSRRDFSSGCIRVEKALELSQLLLRDVAGWDAARIERSVAGGREETVRLAAPVPVHLLYWTAWAAPDGAVHFRQDIYDRDPALAAALGETPPGPGGGAAPEETGEGE